MSRTIHLTTFGLLTHHAEQVCQTFEQVKAWSQILNQEDLLTRLRNYGRIPDRRQAQVISDMWDKPGEGAANDVELLARIRDLVERNA